MSYYVPGVTGDMTAQRVSGMSAYAVSGNNYIGASGAKTARTSGNS